MRLGQTVHKFERLSSLWRTKTQIVPHKKSGPRKYNLVLYKYNHTNAHTHSHLAPQAHSPILLSVIATFAYVLYNYYNLSPLSAGFQEPQVEVNNDYCIYHQQFNDPYTFELIYISKKYGISFMYLLTLECIIYE